MTARRVRLYTWVAIVGAWGVFVGVAALVASARLLSTASESDAGGGGVATAGFSVSSLITSALEGLSDAGVVAIITGLLLIVVGSRLSSPRRV